MLVSLAAPLFVFFAISLSYWLSSLILPGFFLYDAKRILELALLVWGAVWILFVKNYRRDSLLIFKNLPNLARIAIMLVFVLGLLSVMFAAVPQLAFYEYALFLLLTGFVLLVAAQRVKNGRYFDKVILLVLLSGAAVYVLGFFYVYVRTVITGGVLTFPGFVNFRFLAQYLGWILPFVSLPLFIFNCKKAGKIFVYLLAILLWAIAFANGAKGLFFGLIAGAIFVGFLFREKSKKWLLLQCKIAVVGAAVYVLLFRIIARLFALSTLAPSALTRLVLWKKALSFIVANPLLGVGPMHFAHYPNPIGAHPHNSLLQIGSEWGMPILILMLTLFGLGLTAWCGKFNYKMLAKKSYNEIALLMTLTFSLITGACYSLVSGILVMPISQVMLVIVVGWMLGCYRCEYKNTDQIVVVREIIFAVIVGAILVWFVVAMLSTVYSLTREETAWAVANAHNYAVIFNPRFWIQGWF